MPSSFFRKPPVSGLHLLVVAEILTLMVRETDRVRVCALPLGKKMCECDFCPVRVIIVCVCISMFILGFAARVSVPVG